MERLIIDLRAIDGCGELDDDRVEAQHDSKRAEWMLPSLSTTTSSTSSSTSLDCMCSSLSSFSSPHAASSARTLLTCCKVVLRGVAAVVVVLVLLALALTFNPQTCHHRDEDYSALES